MRENLGKFLLINMRLGAMNSPEFIVPLLIFFIIFVIKVFTTILATASELAQGRRSLPTSFSCGYFQFGTIGVLTLGEGLFKKLSIKMIYKQL